MKSIQPVKPQMKGAAVKAGGALEKAKVGIGELTSGLNRERRERMEEVLRNVGNSRVADSPGFKAMRAYLLEFADLGGTFEDFREEMGQRARAEMRKRAHLVYFAAEMASLIRAPSKRAQFVTEVLMPASRRTISGSQAWDRVQAITGRDVLAASRDRGGGGHTFVLGCQLEFACIASVQCIQGIGALRYDIGCHYEAISYGLGISVEAELTGVGEWIASAARRDSWNLTVGIGAGLGVSGCISVGFRPAFMTKHDLWHFDGITVNVGAAAGVEITLAFEMSCFNRFKWNPPEFGPPAY